MTRILHMMWLAAVLAATGQAAAEENPKGGALAGERYRVIISTDIGGLDPDDFQSMVHYLVYADLFDTEGLIASPPHQGSSRDILECIAAYEKDYPKLRTYSEMYPTPAALRAVTKDGARDPAPVEGFSGPTAGSRQIIQQAQQDDARPLYVLVWGGLTDVAQAVHDEPTIKPKLRVYYVGSSNTRNDPHARRYLIDSHRDLWLIETDSTFRGMYMGGKQEGDLSNRGFVAEHVKGHGALGAFYFEKMALLKMGDTPSVLYLLRGDPEDPISPHWGGQFVKVEKGERPALNYFSDDRSPEAAEVNRAGAKTVNRWREAYLRDWQARMDRCQQARGE